MPIPEFRVVGDIESRALQSGFFQDPRLQRSTNPLMKILQVAETPLNVLASSFIELQPEVRGLPGGGVGRVFERAIKERPTFADVTGNPYTGFVLDVAADPLNLLGFPAVAGGVLKAGKFATKATGLRKTYRFIENTKRFQRIEEGLGKVLVGPDFINRKYRPGVAKKIRRAMENDLQRNVKGAWNETAELIMDLAPSHAERVKLIDIYEDLPIEYFLMGTDTGVAGRLGVDTTVKLPTTAEPFLADLIRNPTLVRNADEFANSRSPFIAAVQDLQDSNIATNIKLRSQIPEASLEAIRKDPNMIEGVLTPMGRFISGDELAKLPASAKGVFKDELRELYKLFTKGNVKFTSIDQILSPDIIARIGNLSVGARAALDLAVRTERRLEAIKLKNGLLTLGQAAGFFTKAGRPHILHRHAYKDEVTTLFQEASRRHAEYTRLKAAGASTEELLKVRKMEGGKVDIFEIGDAKETDFFLKQIDDMNEAMPNPEMTAISKLFIENDIAKARVTQGKAVNIRQLGVEIDTDIASVLGAESIQVARAMVNRKYVRTLLSYARSKKLIVTKAQQRDPEILKKILVDRFGDDNTVRKLMREGFVPVEGFDELKGWMVPRGIADEVTRIVNAYTNPKALQDFLHTWKKHQDVWKAYTLSLFPAYHSRNLVSNLWNNFLAGMDVVSDPRVAQDYWHSYQILRKHRLGADLDDVTKVIGNMTEKEFINMALTKRVIGGSGEIGVEASAAMDRARANVFMQLQSADAGKALKKRFGRKDILSIDPQRNAFVQTGFDIGNVIEEHARLSHFMWRLRKGDSANDAVDSVFKFLFDYKYGLSPIEQKFGRDFLMPFYAWTKFNVPLQVEMLIRQPHKFAMIPKSKSLIENVLGGPEPEEMFQAEWMKRALSVRWKYNKKNGSYEYFMLGSWLPAADISKIFSKGEFKDALMGLLSPGAKLPIELAWNFNLFRKKPIRQFPLETTKLFGKSVLPPEVVHVARTIRLINETDRFLDSSTGSLGGRMLRVITGKSYPFEQEAQKKWWTKELNIRIKDLKWFRTKAIDRDERGNVRRLDELISQLEKAQKEFGVSSAVLRREAKQRKAQRRLRELQR